MRVHGAWLLTAERAAVHLPTATAVVADMHLGYAAARRQRGDALPADDVRDLVRDFAALVRRLAVRRLVFAGDLVEDGAGIEAANDIFAELRRQEIDVLGLVPGNHDRKGDLGALTLPILDQRIEIDGWRICHGDGPLGSWRAVCGHFHPIFRLAKGIAAPCYLIGARRIVLPAFSADAAGANVLRARRWAQYRCAVIVADEVLDFGVLARLRAVKARIQNSEFRIRNRIC